MKTRKIKGGKTKTMRGGSVGAEVVANANVTGGDVLDVDPTKGAGYCAPSAIKNYRRFRTCFSREALERMALLYNSTNPLNAIVVDSKKTVRELWTALAKRFESQCKSNEACWLSTEVVRTNGSQFRAMFDKYFRPMMPSSWKKDPYTWLSNYDIQAVMKQYEEAYPDFRFLGVFPIDFAAPDGWGSCISREMCSLSLEDLQKGGIRQIGAIFNLDKHNEPGSHWVMLYANFDYDMAQRNYGIFYYDSNAVEPPKEIMDFMNKVQGMVAVAHRGKTRRVFKKNWNRKRHQYGNTECGMFSMYRLVQLINGKTFREVVESREFDKAVHDLRTVYFRPDSSSVV